jgi:hypothetical protein
VRTGDSNRKLTIKQYGMNGKRTYIGVPAIQIKRLSVLAEREYTYWVGPAIRIANSSLPSNSKETEAELPSNQIKQAESPAEDCQRSNSFSKEPMVAKQYPYRGVELEFASVLFAFF